MTEEECNIFVQKDQPIQTKVWMSIDDGSGNEGDDAELWGWRGWQPFKCWAESECWGMISRIVCGGEYAAWWMMMMMMLMMMRKMARSDDADDNDNCNEDDDDDGMQHSNKMPRPIWTRQT
jgi:hypothetical protein